MRVFTSTLGRLIERSRSCQPFVPTHCSPSDLVRLPRPRGRSSSSPPWADHDSPSFTPSAAAFNIRSGAAFVARSAISSWMFLNQAAFSSLVPGTDLTRVRSMASPPALASSTKSDADFRRAVRVFSISSSSGNETVVTMVLLER